MKNQINKKTKSSSDIELAKTILKTENLTCVLIKDDIVYKSTASGIAPMLSWIGQDKNLNNFSAADKIVGRAAAMLFIDAGITCVHAVIISRGAAQLFMTHKINFTFETMTEEITNRAGTGTCPMELAVKNLINPKDAFSVLKAEIQKLSQRA